MFWEKGAINRDGVGGIPVSKSTVAFAARNWKDSIGDMNAEDLTSAQKDIPVTVGRYPGQFNRRSLSKLLFGVKSWKDKE